MSQTVNLDTKYSKKIDQAFTIASLLKGRLSAENEFVGARTVRIHNINTVPLNDYNRGASANRYGEPAEVGDTVQELTMTQDKSFSGVIDKGNNMDQSINKAGTAPTGGKGVVVKAYQVKDGAFPSPVATQELTS